MTIEEIKEVIKDVPEESKGLAMGHPILEDVNYHLQQLLLKWEFSEKYQYDFIPEQLQLTIDDTYKVGDVVFVHHKMNAKVVTSIGFLVYTANRDNTILARTINPLSDIIIISDDDFICLGHIEDLEKSN